MPNVNDIMNDATLTYTPARETPRTQDDHAPRRSDKQRQQIREHRRREAMCVRYGKIEALFVLDQFLVLWAEQIQTSVLRKHNIPYDGVFCRRWLESLRELDKPETHRPRPKPVSAAWLYLCRLLTLGFHWWKHYPGERRYVRCRICGRQPGRPWQQLQKMLGRPWQQLQKMLGRG
jgi:hypothetical protein